MVIRYKSLTYDADGNLTKDVSNEYTWNARGQLTGISGANTASFSYNPFGRRSAKTLGGTTTKLLYDGPNVVQESVEGKVTADLLTGLAADQLFSRTTKAGTSSYLTNLLGSPIALANSSAKVKTSYTYHPFGGMTKEGEATDNPYQFTGRENDGTGLQYNRARYYSPSMGRFISQDPAGFVDGANLYGYVGGAPLDFTDPTGECTALESATVAGMVVCGERMVAEWQNELNGWANKIGNWAGCGDEVTSEPDLGEFVGEGAEGAVTGAAGGGGSVGAAKGGAWGLVASLAEQWLRTQGCGGMADALRSALDAVGDAELVGAGGTPIPLRPPMPPGLIPPTPGGVPGSATPTAPLGGF